MTLEFAAAFIVVAFLLTVLLAAALVVIVGLWTTVRDSWREAHPSDRGGQP